MAACPGVGLDIPTVTAQALRLEGWDAGSDAAPDIAEAGRTALELNARSLASPEEELADARKAFRECSSGATHLLAADLTTATTVAIAQLMDDVDGFASSEGATQLRMHGFVTAGSEIGQIFRPGPGKTEGMWCGFTPKSDLTI